MKPSIVCVVLGTLSLAAAPAVAEEKTDLEVFREGKTQFDLGNFDKAIELFKRAYELSNKPVYLYNVGSAYENQGDCRSALQFYETFLRRADAQDKPLPAKTRASVDERIALMQECVAKLPPPVDKPPVDKPPGDKPPGDKPPGDKPPVVGQGGSDGSRDDECIDGDEPACGEDPTGPGRPPVIVARASGGLGLIGAGDLEVPAQVALGLSAAYPLRLQDKLTLELGAAFGFSPVPYEAGSMDGSASMTTLVAQVGATYAVARKVNVQLAVGGGVLLFGGLQTGNPFTNGGAPTTGALTTPAFRVGLLGEYAVTDNVLLHVSPFSFSYSPAAKGLIEGIDALTRIEFTAGIGFRR